jgi:DNA-binding NtrC family response regulator
MEKVLSIGRNPELLQLRQAVLENAGFHVHTTYNEAEAHRVIQSGDCGVLLLSYSLDVELRKQLVEAFRSRCPRGRVVSIYNKELSTPFFADVMVFGLDGPEALIQAVRGD